MENRPTRTAAYCRVSTDMEEQESSYELQVQYYRSLIQSNPEMELVGIYGDKGKTGLSAKRRPGLQRLIEDCKAGKIDLILTKSISRFSRKMSECAAMVRELGEYGVDIHFEKENVNTRDTKSTLIMHIFAAVAEEESNSISRHAILAHEQYAQEGRPFGTVAFGYRDTDDHRWEIDEAEARAVRKAFQMASLGECYAEIRNELNRMDFGGRIWSQERLKKMLTNLVYKGDYFSHASVCLVPGKKVKNDGYRDRYYIEEHHDPIVSSELFDKVQKIVESGLLDSNRHLKDVDIEFLEGLNEQIPDEHYQTQIRRESQERFCGGIAPFGYVRVGGKLKKDPIAAQFVQQMFLKAKEGEHATDIAFWLETEGIRSPRGSSRWSDSTVRDILKNSVYADDLVSRELYDAVQERYHSRAKTVERKPGAYQGLVLCASCGKPMAYHGAGGKDRRKTAIYACKYHTGANPKGQPLERMPKIDEEVLGAEVMRQCKQYYQSMHRSLRKKELAKYEDQQARAKQLLRSITVYFDGRVEVEF